VINIRTLFPCSALMTKSNFCLYPKSLRHGLYIHFFNQIGKRVCCSILTVMIILGKSLCHKRTYLISLLKSDVQFLHKNQECGISVFNSNNIE